MAYDSFLKIEGIKGESLDSKHKDEIEVLSFSWGATQPGAFGGGGGTGKVSAQDFSFVVKIDKSSPLLFKHLATGGQGPGRLPQVQVHGHSHLFVQSVDASPVDGPPAAPRRGRSRRDRW